MKKLSILLLTLALLLAFAACEWEPVEEDPPVDEDVAETQADEEPAEEVSWLTFDSYEDLYAAISEAAAANGTFRSETAQTNQAIYEEEAVAADEGYGAGGGGDYSVTNVQVEGVDEADIVKCNGEYIFVLRGDRVTVVKADGAGSEVVNSFTVCDSEQENGYEYAPEMYLGDGKLYTIIDSHSWQNDTASTKTILRCFDVSDPAGDIALDYEVAQDGYYLDSRFSDGVLYMFSNLYIFSEPDEDDPQTYVPVLYDKNGDASAVAIEDVAGCPGFSGVQYAILSCYDAAGGDRLDQQTVLGAGSTVYMNEDDLFLAKGRYEETCSEPYTESIYQVVDYTLASYTDIVRFDISNGQLEMKAFTEMEGYLSDQFALDEYEGYLRVALTVNKSSYKIYTDEEFGFSNYLWGEDSDTVDNCLYVLDGNLQPVGQLSGLAQDEWIRSVRFLGPVGYICTFETIDPLFAIDLSDPTSPQLLSALEIPGFSEYLHPWGKDRLIGLGYAVEDGSTLDQVKLSMFDCSDLTDVKETDKYVIDDLWYSEALYNHKAVTASVDKNLICFPGDGSYLIFGYDEEQGFQLKAEVSLSQEYWYDWNSRGLWAGDYFYVASSCGVIVLDLADLSTVKELYFEDAQSPNNWLYID